MNFTTIRACDDLWEHLSHGDLWVATVDPADADDERRLREVKFRGHVIQSWPTIARTRPIRHNHNQLHYRIF